MNAINYCPFGKKEEIVEAMTGLRDAVCTMKATSRLSRWRRYRNEHDAG